MSGVCENTEIPDLDEDILFEKLITLKNILCAWKKFSRGKWRQKPVQKFWLNLERELKQLYHDLQNNFYCHGPYHSFTLYDLKRREISVPETRDRVVHQLLADYLEKKFRSHFIKHSYASQKGKGVAVARIYVLKAIRRLLGYKGEVFVARLDVEKYFLNIDHEILIKLLRRRIKEKRILSLCQTIIESFGQNGRGMPLGNITSQWFGNIYLHELDWFVKHILHIRYYIRYNDDIIILSLNENILRGWVEKISEFVIKYLKLRIPPYKQEIAYLPLCSIDILGWRTNGYKHSIRPATLRRAKKNLFLSYQKMDPKFIDSLCSYIGGKIINSDILLIRDFHDLK